jgi:hypothetical protein
MRTAVDFFNLINNDLRGVFDTLPDSYTFNIDGSDIVEDLDSLLIDVVINFKFGNICHKHEVHVVADFDQDIYGIDFGGEEFHPFKINHKNVLLSMYQDIALIGLDERFMA